MATRGVHVVTVKPGFIDSPMTAHITKKGALWATPGSHRRRRPESDRQAARRGLSAGILGIDHADHQACTRADFQTAEVLTTTPGTCRATPALPVTQRSGARGRDGFQSTAAPASRSASRSVTQGRPRAAAGTLPQPGNSMTASQTSTPRTIDAIAPCVVARFQ